MAAMRQTRPDPYEIMKHNTEGWARREDNSVKGSGFLGVLPSHNSVSSELSIPEYENKNGVGPEIPSIVPTMSAASLNRILNGTAQPGDYVQAIAFAKQRQAQGKPVFASEGEQDYNALPTFRRIK